MKLYVPVQECKACIQCAELLDFRHCFAWWLYLLREYMRSYACAKSYDKEGDSGNPEHAGMALAYKAGLDRLGVAGAPVARVFIVGDESHLEAYME